MKPLNWEEETRFDGPEHWGGDPRWKHLFPKSGTPGTFVPVDIDGIAADSTDDNASQMIDELDMLDAGRSHHGGRDQKKSGESRRWRQGKETEPPSSSSRRYSEDEDDGEFAKRYESHSTLHCCRIKWIVTNQARLA